jgi:periplasmic nitrate reductase NapE
MSPEDQQRKTEEWRTWVFFTIIMAPLAAVLIVSGFGFVVWMWQTFIAGPPSY